MADAPAHEDICAYRNLGRFLDYQGLALRAEPLRPERIKTVDGLTPVETVSQMLTRFGRWKMVAERTAAPGRMTVLFLVTAAGTYAHSSADLRELLASAGQGLAAGQSLERVIVLAPAPLVAKKNAMQVLAGANEAGKAGDDKAGKAAKKSAAADKNSAAADKNSAAADKKSAAADKKSAAPAAAPAAAAVRYDMYPFSAFATVVPEHPLVPLHEVLPPEEARAQLAQLRLVPRDLPRILAASDLAAIWAGVQPGDVVRVTRVSETAGSAVVLRIAV